MSLLTLWDLLRKPPAQSKPLVTAHRKPTAPKAGTMRATPARDRYETMERTMLAEHRIRVRKWRTSSSGVAWEVHYRDGTVSRLIESPRPRGPISAAIFLHEVGHHAIGFHTYRPRCLEEYHAWRYALEQMERWQLNVTQRVLDRRHDALHYAIAKARRRGLKRLPAELVPFLEPRTTPKTPAPPSR